MAKRSKPKVAKAAAKQFAKSMEPKGGAPTKGDSRNSVAHLIDSVKFNAAHSMRHAQEAAAHADKLAKHLKKHPAVDAELKKLHDAKENE